MGTRRPRFENLGLLTSDSDDDTATLFGRQARPRSRRWRYYARIHDSDTNVPVERDGQRCFTGGWPWCDELRQGDTISLTGKAGTWTVSELWPVSCAWEGSHVVCDRVGL